MFLRSSIRPQAVDCFFCLSPSLLPPSNDPSGKGKGREVGTKWNWNCERCGCWNVRDERGEMVSELPQMKTPIMNKRSFELRAKPSSSHLPSTTVASPFCHICLTNQTLIMNMLANYLPDEDDPTYPSLYADLPEYLHGVHTRYPPVCHNCQPAVDDALRKANHRANVDAWGSALRRTDIPITRSCGDGMVDILIWRLRGVCFGISAGVSLGLGACCVVRPELLQMTELGVRGKGARWLVIWHTISILWMAWDPYWLRLRRRNLSRTRIMGRRKWLIDMAMIYFLRLSMAIWAWYTSTSGLISTSITQGFRAAFVIEITILLHAFSSLRITAPVRTRPIEPLTLSRPVSPRPTHPTSTQSPILQRQIQSTNPIFGLPAFTTSTNIQEEQEVQYEPMDWEPSPTIDRFRRPPGLEDDYDNGNGIKDDWDSFAINKQRMFAPGDGDETGLESLIAGWGIDPNPPKPTHQDQASLRDIRSTGDKSGFSTPSTTQIGELIVRTASSLLTIARIIILILIISSTISSPRSHTIDQILSGIEVGTIVMSAILLPRQYPSPRIAILAGDLILHLVYAVFQRHSQFNGLEQGRDAWMVGMTWGQWALLNATRAMI